MMKPTVYGSKEVQACWAKDIEKAELNGKHKKTDFPYGEKSIVVLVSDAITGVLEDYCVDAKDMHTRRNIVDGVLKKYPVPGRTKESLEMFVIENNH
jgi:hypothetical protein